MGWVPSSLHPILSKSFAEVCPVASGGMVERECRPVGWSAQLPKGGCFRSSLIIKVLCRRLSSCQWWDGGGRVQAGAVVGAASERGLHPAFLNYQSPLEESVQFPVVGKLGGGVG